MNNLEIKKVDFQGTELIAAQDKETNKIYVGVRWVCNGIGLTAGQKDRQVKNIQNDFVLKKGAKKLSVKFDVQVRNILCIELDYLPLWLAKITITPDMAENNPDLTQKLIEYQLKAKDVLAEAFIKNSYKVPQTYIEALEAHLEAQKEIERQKLIIAEQEPKALYFDKLVDRNLLTNIRDTAKELHITQNEFVKFLLDNNYLYRDGKNKLKPFSEYITASGRKGLFEIKDWYNSKNDKTGVQTLITPRGRETFRLLLK